MIYLCNKEKQHLNFIGKTGICQYLQAVFLYGKLGVAVA